jgi:hypothetical protein
LTTALFRFLPMGSITAKGARLLSEQHAVMSDMHAALGDFPAIDAEMPHQLKIDDPVALRYQSGPEPDGPTCARAPSPEGLLDG